jgi:hypothetical protein
MCRVRDSSIGDRAVTTVTGTWKNGRIILDSPTDWPNGCRVIIEPVPDADNLGIREEDWAETPEAIAEWLRWYDSLEPLLMTPEEEANWQDALNAQKRLSVENWTV